MGKATRYGYEPLLGVVYLVARKIAGPAWDLNMLPGEVEICERLQTPEDVQALYDLLNSRAAEFDDDVTAADLRLKWYEAAKEKLRPSFARGWPRTFARIHETGQIEQIDPADWLLEGGGQWMKHTFQTEASSPAKRAGGRRPKYPWEKLKQYAMQLLDHHGLPSPENPDFSSQADLERKIVQQCRDLTGGAAPPISQVREHVSAWIREYRAAKAGNSG
jgi:hypothetical protein